MCLFAKVLRRWGKDKWEHRTSLAGVVDNEGARGRGDGGNPVAMIVVIGNVTHHATDSRLWVASITRDPTVLFTLVPEKRRLRRQKPCLHVVLCLVSV